MPTLLTEYSRILRLAIAHRFITPSVSFAERLFIRMNKYFDLAIFLIAATLFSAVWGRSVEVLAKSRTVNKLSLRMMSHCRAPQDKIRFYIIWLSYLLEGLLGIVLGSVIYGINPIDMLIPIHISDTSLFTLAGFILQLEVSSVLLLVCSLLKSDVNWYRVISEINWVKVSFNLPRKIRMLYPTSAALFEELFFRCIIFFVLLKRFDWIPLPVMMMIVAALFIIEQVVCTQKVKQAVAMAVGALAISFAGCLMIVITNSIIPAIICHEMYVIFYLKK